MGRNTSPQRRIESVTRRRFVPGFVVLTERAEGEEEGAKMGSAAVSCSAIDAAALVWGLTQ